MAGLLTVCALIFAFAKIPQPGRCLTKQQVFHVNKQEYLANHVMETKQAESEMECAMHCVSNESCASVNYKTSGLNKGLCELNTKRRPSEMAEGHEVSQNSEFNYLFKIKAVSGIETVNR